MPRPRHLQRTSPSRADAPDGRRPARRSTGRRSARCRRSRRRPCPGVPAHASSPASPRPIVQRTSAFMRHAGVGAHDAGSPPAAIRPPCGRTTRPRTPASAISTFEPPPSTVTGTPAAAPQRRATPTISSPSCASTSQSAGPADAERRERRERRLERHALGADDRRTSAAPATSGSGDQRLALSRSAAASLRIISPPASRGPPAAPPAASRGCRRSRRST